MKSNRVIILSLYEVEEAVKSYVRKKYHEKLCETDVLTSISTTESLTEFHFSCKECVE